MVTQAIWLEYDIDMGRGSVMSRTQKSPDSARYLYWAAGILLAFWGIVNVAAWVTQMPSYVESEPIQLSPEEMRMYAAQCSGQRQYGRIALLTTMVDLEDPDPGAEASRLNVVNERYGRYVVTTGFMEMEDRRPLDGRVIQWWNNDYGHGVLQLATYVRQDPLAVQSFKLAINDRQVEVARVGMIAETSGTLGALAEDSVPITGMAVPPVFQGLPVIKRGWDEDKMDRLLNLVTDRFGNFAVTTGMVTSEKLCAGDEEWIVRHNDRYRKVAGILSPYRRRAMLKPRRFVLTIDGASIEMLRFGVVSSIR